MNEIEIGRIAAAVNQLRPDWPVASLRTLLESPQLVNRPRRDVAVAFAWIASDAATKTPGRIKEQGPWWNAAATEDNGPHRPNLPPCPVHQGETIPCGRCRHEANRADHAAGIEAARAAIKR